MTPSGEPAGITAKTDPQETSVDEQAASGAVPHALDGLKSGVGSPVKLPTDMTFVGDENAGGGSPAEEEPARSPLSSDEPAPSGLEQRTGHPSIPFRNIPIVDGGGGEGGPPTEKKPARDEFSGDPSTSWSTDEWLKWPPDVFALTSIVLRSTGAYRFAASPEHKDVGVRVQKTAEKLRDDWFAWIFTGGSRPDNLANLAAKAFGIKKEKFGFSAKESETPLVRHLMERFQDILDRLERPRADRQAPKDDPKAALDALLELHAYADEVCHGFGLPHGPRDGFEGVYLGANMLLERTGTLSRLPREYGFVLPKLRTPQRGLTLRGLSHNLAYHHTEVDIRWRTVPWINQDQNNVNILAVPWPWHVHASAFRPTTYPGAAQPDPTDGFFEYHSDQPLDIAAVLDLYREARHEVGRVHVMVFPELALARDDLRGLQAALEKEAGGRAPMIVAGLRGDGKDAAGKRTNRVSVSTYFSGQWYEIAQDKHHRWMLDASQIRQYSIGGALNVSKKWWEAIDIPRRALTFLAPNDWLTLCPLICEDLAQLEPVSEVIRGVGPTLVIALLMDGPQLAQRWPARYVSVLADDPGTSVLSLTSLGMARRSRELGGAAGERGKPAESRAVALWKDQDGGTKVIELGPDARAFLMTVNARGKTEYTIDGRRDGGSATFVFEGVHDLNGRRKMRRSGNIPIPAGTPARGDSDVEDLTVFAYFVDAVLDAEAEERTRLSRCIDYRNRPQAERERRRAAEGEDKRDPRDLRTSVTQNRPHEREPFCTMWDRVYESRWAAMGNGRNTQRTREFQRALKTFMYFMKDWEGWQKLYQSGQTIPRLNAAGSAQGAGEPARRPTTDGERLVRWYGLERAAAVRLMGLHHEQHRPGANADKNRIRRLAHLFVLWAIHNRVNRRLQEVVGNPGLCSERNELYQLLIRIEQDLEMYS